jgi:signal transduction histidine kinase
MNLMRWLKNWWNTNLRRRLLVSNVVTTLVFLAILGVLSFRIGRTSVQYEVNQGNKRLATLVAKDISMEYEMIIHHVQLFRDQMETLALTRMLQARAMLELRRTAPLTYRALYLFDREGQLLIHLTESLDDLQRIQQDSQILDRPSIPLTQDVVTAYKAARLGEFFRSTAQIIGIDQVPVIYMGVPLASDHGQPDHIIVMEVDLRDIWRRIDEIYVGQTGQAFIVSRKGMIIAHPDRRYIGQPIVSVSKLEPVVIGYEGQTEYIDPISGRRMLASYSPVGKQSGWGIVIEQEKTEALASVDKIASITLRVLAAAVLIAVMITTLIARSITRPIQHLARVTQTIAQTGDLNYHIDVERQDEVGRLSHTFNQMITRLQQANQEISTLNEELEQRVIERTAQLEAVNKNLQEAQEQLVRKEKLAILGQLAGGVGHELRNPLGVIFNAVYYLKMLLSETDETIKEYLEMIASEVRNAEKIVSDLLDFARIKSVEKEKVVVSEQVAWVLERQPLPEGVQVTTEIPADLPSVFVDPRQIEQVLLNLVINAYQAMSNGGVLTISAQGEKGKVILSVTDTGIGIPEEHKKKLFEPLFTTKVRGIGLGLAVSKNLIEANEGSIEVESEVGKGSTFTVILPTREYDS